MENERNVKIWQKYCIVYILSISICDEFFLLIMTTPEINANLTAVDRYLSDRYWIPIDTMTDHMRIAVCHLLDLNARKPSWFQSEANFLIPQAFRAVIDSWVHQAAAEKLSRDSIHIGFFWFYFEECVRRLCYPLITSISTSPQDHINP